MRWLLAALLCAGLLACGDDSGGSKGDGGAASDGAMASDGARTSDGAAAVDAGGGADAAANACAVLAACCTRLNIPEFKPFCEAEAASNDPQRCQTTYDNDKTYCP